MLHVADLWAVSIVGQVARLIFCPRILPCGTSGAQTCDHQIMSSTHHPFGHSNLVGVLKKFTLIVMAELDQNMLT